MATVADHLPRAPRDTGFVVYRYKGKTKKGREQERHHQFFRADIAAPPFLQAKLGSTHIVEPLRFEDFDEAAFQCLPVDGIPKKLPVHLVAAEEEELQADAEKCTSAEDPKTGMNEEEPVAPKCLVHDEDGAPGDKNTGVSSAMLLHWRGSQRA
eukprot:1764721-Pleurochrysis_carterae.AAC.2